MADLPHPWDAYASIQSQLSADPKCGDRSWGLEQALNQIVLLQPPLRADVAKVQATAARRARYGRALISKYEADLICEGPSLIGQLEARSDLGRLRRHLAPADYAILISQTLRHRSSGLQTDAQRARLSRARRRARRLMAA
jgi:hypothetical protein